MRKRTPFEVTQLLQRWGGGDQSVLGDVIEIVYADLRRCAQRELRKERRGHTLQATALVNETYQKMVRLGGLEFQHRAQFFGLAVHLMRRILIDYARKRRTGVDGNGTRDDDALEFLQAKSEDWETTTAIYLAVEKLAEIHPRWAEVAKMRLFDLLPVEVVAKELKVSENTVIKDWEKARLWLAQALSTRQK